MGAICNACGDATIGDRRGRSRTSNAQPKGMLHDRNISVVNAIAIAEANDDAIE